MSPTGSRNDQEEAADEGPFADHLAAPVAMLAARCVHATSRRPSHEQRHHSGQLEPAQGSRSSSSGASSPTTTSTRSRASARNSSAACSSATATRATRPRRKSTTFMKNHALTFSRCRGTPAAAPGISITGRALLARPVFVCAFHPITVRRETCPCASCRSPMKTAPTCSPASARRPSTICSPIFPGTSG